ncbi:MAG: D-glucuronyl C5-epimerase family protein [bacterium]|nr:D-glucuronyl C5-epimerase family protein [bacterium]
MELKKKIDNLLMYFKGKDFSYWQLSNGGDTKINLPILGRYFLDFTPMLREGHYDKFDQEGIPLRNYGGSVGVRYNPTRIASYGLGNLDLYLSTGNSAYKERFLKQAEWFVKNQKLRKGRIGVWEYNFDWTRGLKAPWISCMAQGQGLSLLCRAYLLTNDTRFLEIARHAIEAFKSDIEEGGIVSYIKDRFICFEEYPTNPPSYTLNGFIFALVGLYEYYKVTKEKDAQGLFNSGVETLENCLYLYDTGYWSRYDLYSDVTIASYSYHNVHIVQLEMLYQLTGKKIFKEYADKWRRYRESLFNRFRALILKSLHKLIKFKKEGR